MTTVECLDEIIPQEMMYRDDAVQNLLLVIPEENVKQNLDVNQQYHPVVGDVMMEMERGETERDGCETRPQGDW
jgi:hypothetical protein